MIKNEYQQLISSTQICETYGQISERVTETDKRFA